ncbi:hypothetical protein BDZ97DRAFT_51184 [Flammula alnicola]|nr:hypothetical protein BDZ97DRAFT_51184 [Flammula alnicola]
MTPCSTDSSYVSRSLRLIICQAWFLVIYLVLFSVTEWVGFLVLSTSLLHHSCELYFFKVCQ